MHGNFNQGDTMNHTNYEQQAFLNPTEHLMATAEVNPMERTALNEAYWRMRELEETLAKEAKL